MHDLVERLEPGRLTIDSLSSSAPNNVHTGENLYVAPQNNENAVTGKLGYTYHLNDEMMVYGTASTGHKGVAYDMTSGANNVNVFAHLPLAPENRPASRPASRPTCGTTAPR